MTHPVSEFIVTYLNWVFILFLGLNLYQRGAGEKGRTKRFATLYLAVVAFCSVVGAQGLIYFKLSDWFLLPIGALLVAASVVFRARLFPFRLTCRSCRKRLSFQQMLFIDANLCGDCSAQEEERPTPS